MRFARPALVLVLLALAGGCATREPPAASDPPAAAAPPAAEPDFEDRLARAGVPLDLPDEGKALVVNIPAFELIAFEDAEPVFESRVIVGTPANPTPVLETHTTKVRFRPTWRPTPNMIASGEYQDRVWPPGENNPLGLAAVRLEPGLLVYLHDTNRPELFERENRALSHGCVRVERWRELVAWLLDWSPERVDRVAHGEGTRDVATPDVPVHLGYFTAFPDPDGGIERYADLYDRAATTATTVSFDGEVRSCVGVVGTRDMLDGGG
ncbi:MAG: L,D-transpeptidase family protein [Alphaproteobacteria bacterium]|jgi:murein L,D-transpeptidase YcbB/YkuD|nr:L,D-transpeptidase family protein [Alphaproteobacteria bacterium]